MSSSTSWSRSRIGRGCHTQHRPSPVVLGIAEQRRHESQDVVAADAEIQLPKMLKGLEQQAAARQQRDARAVSRTMNECWKRTGHHADDFIRTIVHRDRTAQHVGPGTKAPEARSARRARVARYASCSTSRAGFPGSPSSRARWPRQLVILRRTAGPVQCVGTTGHPQLNGMDRAPGHTRSAPLLVVSSDFCELGPCVSAAHGMW